MEHGAKVATVIALYSLAMMSPGPNFVVVIRASMSESRRNGIFAGMGVATGSTAWAAFGSLGMARLLAQAPWIYEGLKLAGGLYLVYLAWKFFRGARNPLDVPAASVRGGRGFWMSYKEGLLTNMTNPKSAVFFASLFASTDVLSPTTPGWVYAALVSSIGALSLCWHTSLALVLSCERIRRVYQRAKVIIDVVCGSLMALVGSRMMASVLY